MATFVFDQPSAEVEDGTDSNDLFIASNNNLNAGDRAFGKLGIDDFQYFADSSLTGGSGFTDFFGNGNFFNPVPTKTFAAFILNSVETFTTVNDSGNTLVFDFSSSTGLTDLVVANSTSAVIYDQVQSLANVRLVQQTNATTTNVAVGYAASLTGGANDSVNLVLDGTNGNTVRLGTATGTVGQPTNAGIETVVLTGLNGDSTINRLDTNLTTLLIDDAPGAFDITINSALNTTVRTITSATDGDVTLSFANNGVGVAYTGSNTLSANTVVGGAGNDVFNTFGGNDTINAGAGNDTINVGDGANRVLTGAGVNSVTSGSGRDIIYAQGASDTVASGLGDDVVNARANGQLAFTGGDGSDLVIADGTFNASIGNDSLNFGANFDVLIVDAGTTDGQYAQVSGLESIALLNAGTTTLGSTAQAAGINTVFLGSGTAGNDVVNASAFTSGLTIQAASSNSAITDAALETTQGLQNRFAVYTAGGGDDAITTGSGTDFFLFRGDNALTSADNLNAGANGGGVGIVGDTLVLNGDTTLAGGGFTGFEFVALESVTSRDPSNYPGAVNNGNVYNLTLNNTNAPTSGRLFINGSALTAGGGAIVAETVTIDASAVTAFGLDVTTGAAGDTITLGTVSSAVSTQGGNDTVNDSASATANDVIDTGLGNDIVNLSAGNNTVFDAGGNNTITLGNGNDAVYIGGGNDTIVAGANLTGADTLVDGGGYDVVRIGGRNYTDADFAGVNTGAFVGFEELEVSGNFTYTLGANAQRAGFQLIQATDNAASTINVGAWTRAVTVDLEAGGDDVVVLGTAAAGTENLVLAGTGTQNVTGGTGVDVLRVQGAELDALDVFAAGAGVDRVELDNSTGAVTANVGLTNFSNVERYVLTDDGNRAPGVDADDNTIVFRDAALTAVNSLTQIVVDSSALTDVDDTFTVTLDASLQDADFAFDIIGNDVATTLVKNNGGINNNIFLVGGDGVDTFIALGGDFGSTTTFDGNGGTEDRILLSGGTISDDGFVNISEVEVLGAIAGQTVQATLGTEASQSGLVRVDGTTGNDNVLFDPAFTTAITVNLGGGGDDVINATATAAVVTFREAFAQLTAGDQLFGGTTANDVLNLAAGAGSEAADATNVVGVETINITMPSVPNGSEFNHTLTLDTAIGEVTGGTQVINVITDNDSHDFILQGGAATANLNVNAGAGWDDIRTGSGNDTVNTGSGVNQVNTGLGTDIVNGGTGTDLIYGGLGSDTLNGGGGNDQLTGDDGTGAGGAADTINGDAGADRIRGEGGNDIIHGGADNDTIYGGAGADEIWGDAGADTYLYAGLADSAFNARDIVHMDSSDVFDFRDLAATGTSVDFKGSYATFEDAQSAIVAGDGVIDVVFNQASSRLWVDLNDDGTLDGNDLQITIVFEGGATDVTAANIFEGSVAPTPLADFSAGFTAPFAP